MDFTKEAIAKIEEMSKPMVQLIDGHTYLFENGGDYVEVLPNLDEPKTVYLSSLDALVKMVKTEAMKIYDKPLYITIPDAERVECFGQPKGDLRNRRITYYVAKATDIPGWQEKVELGYEEAIIAMNSRFQETPDVAYVMKLLSDITSGASMTLSDNGVATTVMTKKGVALQESAKIRGKVTLRPYRTFQEVEQPASQFLIRVSERSIKFIEADGGMWRLEARKTVKAFLEEELKSEVSMGHVVVAL